MAKNNAFNFNRLSKYNFSYIPLEEVLMLEYILYHYTRKLDMPVQASKIELETGLKRQKQQKAIDDLLKKGFIHIVQVDTRKKYTPDIEKLILAVPRLAARESRYISKFYGSLYENPEKAKDKTAKSKKAKKSTKNEKATTLAGQISLFD